MKPGVQQSSQKQKMISGEFYNPTDKELTAARVRARWLADRFNRTRAWNIPFRSFLIKRSSLTVPTVRFLNRISG